MKRPVTFGFKFSDLKEVSEIPVTPESEPTNLRPPSRHKDPPKALGLYLPPGTCTPPDSNSGMSDKLWSLRSKRGETREKSHMIKRAVDVPMTAQVFEEGMKRPKTQGRARTKIRIQNQVKSPAFEDEIFKRPASGKLYDVPVIINRDEKVSRRVLSANVTAGRSPKIRPPSFKPAKPAFQSSLDSGFLNLFDM